MKRPADSPSASYHDNCSFAPGFQIERPADGNAYGSGSGSGSGSGWSSWIGRPAAGDGVGVARAGAFQEKGCGCGFWEPGAIARL